MTGANLRVDDERWRKYAKAIKDGHSQRTSAKMAGISHSTVMRQYRTPTSRLNRVLGEAGFESAGVLNLDKIKGDAERSINDFGYFRQRYFARSTSHWAEEAAYKMLALAESPNKEYVVVNQPPGVGKALALDTPIATPNGWTTQGEIQIGDELFDENGKVCRVTNKSEIFYDRRCFKVTLTEGSEEGPVIADSEHEWKLADGSIKTSELLQSQETLYGGQKVLVRETLTTATQCIEVDSPSHLYLAGKGLLVTHNSTIWTHDFPVWLAVRDRSTRTMIGSRTAGQATKYTGRIRRTFERVTPVKADPELLERGMAKDAISTLITDFGRFKPSNADLWRLDEFILAQDGGVAVDDKEPNFVAYGMDSGFLGGRFDTVIWDDLVDKTNIRTIESRENLINWWESEAETRLDPGGLLILQGQRMSPDDLYRYALNLVDWSEEFEDQPEKAPKKYHHIIYKAHYDDLCEADKNGGVHKGDYPEGCLLDAYRLPWRELARVKKNKLDKYQTIYQQEDVDAEASLIQQAWIDGGMDKDGVQAQGCWDTSRNIGNWPKGITGFSVVTADPSPTKYWAVQWWGYNPETKMQHLIDLARTPMEAPDFLDYNQDTRTYTGLLEEWWVRSNEQGHPFTYLIVEANAAQRFMLQYDHFKRWSAIRNVNLVPHQTNRNKSDEAYGVQTLAPHYKAGRVRFPAGDYLGSKSVIKPMVKELVQWPEGSTDDCVMAHWFLIWNAPYLFDGNDGQVYQFANRPGWIQKNANRFKRGL